jgi:hypothetical protein
MVVVVVVVVDDVALVLATRGGRRGRGRGRGGRGGYNTQHDGLRGGYVWLLLGAGGLVGLLFGIEGYRREALSLLWCVCVFLSRKSAIMSMGVVGTKI